MVGFVNDPTSRAVLGKSNGLLDFEGSLTELVEIQSFISIRNVASMKAPEHVEGELEKAFNEGASCFAIGCYNAAATMFRLCLDRVTRELLPDERDKTAAQPDSNQRYKLGYRLPWLFKENKLPAELEELADCIKEEGNDGAHVGSLSDVDVELGSTLTASANSCARSKRYAPSSTGSWFSRWSLRSPSPWSWFVQPGTCTPNAAGTKARALDAAPDADQAEAPL